MIWSRRSLSKVCSHMGWGQHDGLADPVPNLTVDKVRLSLLEWFQRSFPRRDATTEATNEFDPCRYDTITRECE